MSILMKRGKVKDIVFIVIGTFLMSVSVNMIYEPAELVTGGVTGIGIVISHITRNIGGGIPIWITNVVLNIPLFLISAKKLGIRYIGKTIIAAVTLTAFLYILPVKAILGQNLLLSAIFGGVVAGAGIGIVFVTTATTGGTDMLGMLIHNKWQYYSVPQLLMVIDGAVVVAGGIVFGIERALLAIIAVYVCSRISGNILDGMKFAKCAYIISDMYRKIAEDIMINLNRGVTGIHGKGMYSDNCRNILFCVATKKEMTQILEIVYQIDGNAFVVISDVREAMGEGFIEYKH